MNLYSFARLLLLCCLGSARVVVAQADAHKPSHDPNDHPPLAKPSNLKVLPADIPIPQLLQLMIGFSQQLSVDCVHCHAPKPGVDPNCDLNFASDANPKKTTARLMMQMTGEINGKYLAQIPGSHAAGPIVCGNCHQGHPVPPAFVTAPPPAH